MSALLNKRQVRLLALDLARKNRAHKFTRVSPEFVNRANSALVMWIMREIASLPSKGRTIK